MWGFRLFFFSPLSIRYTHPSVFSETKANCSQNIYIVCLILLASSRPFAPFELWPLWNARRVGFLPGPPTALYGGYTACIWLAVQYGACADRKMQSVFSLQKQTRAPFFPWILQDSPLNLEFWMKTGKSWHQNHSRGVFIFLVLFLFVHDVRLSGFDPQFSHPES